MFMRRSILVSLFLVVLMGTLYAASTDTVYVPAYKPDGTTPYVNSLIDKVVADTNAAGQQLHTVYKLQSGNFYIISQAVSLRNPVELVADPPVAGTPPAKILSDVDSAGATSTGNLILTWANITLKNIWLGGIDIGGQNNGWGQGNALFVEDSMVTVNLDGVWCDYNGWAAISTTSPHTRWHVNNFHARNEQNAGDQWTTFLFYLETATECDTFIVKNSSYFQSNSCFLFAPNVIKYVEINHCTFVNSYKHPFLSTQWLTAKFTNNIFYNEGSLGMTAAEAESQDPNGLPYGLIDVDTLSANMQGGTPGPYTIPESQRSIVVKNNLWYFSSKIQAYWAAHDTVVPNPFMNARTTAMFANKTAWPGFDVENTWNQDPQFNDFTQLSVADSLLAKACTDIRAGSTHAWDWDGDMTSDPTDYKLLIQYPTAENFRSYSGLKGTDGNPLGDLSFYPASMITGVKKGDVSIPAKFELTQNYPNPFNPATQIEYSIPQSGLVTLKVFNLLGQEVATLLSEVQNAGSYKATFDASRLSSGVYFYRLDVGNFSATKKMILMK